MRSELPIITRVFLWVFVITWVFWYKKILFYEWDTPRDEQHKKGEIIAQDIILSLNHYQSWSRKKLHQKP